MRLQELCLGSELCVTAVFEATRWAVRLATLTWPKTHRQQQRLKQTQQTAAAAAGAWQWGRGEPAKTGSNSSSSRRRVGWGSVSSNEPARKGSDQQQQQQQSDQSKSPPASNVDDIAAAAAAAPSLLRRLQRSKSAGSDLADYHRGTARGASALPRLTLRRVKSVSRWDHVSSSSGQSSGGSSDLCGEAGDDDLSPAAQLILKAGECNQSADRLFICWSDTTSKGNVISWNIVFWQRDDPSLCVGLVWSCCCCC